MPFTIIISSLHPISTHTLQSSFYMHCFIVNSFNIICALCIAISSFPIKQLFCINYCVLLWISYCVVSVRYLDFRLLCYNKCTVTVSVLDMTGELGSQCPILLTIKLHIHRIMDWQKKFEVWLPRSHYFKKNLTKMYET